MIDVLYEDWWQFDECPAGRVGGARLHKLRHRVHVYVLGRPVCMSRELWRELVTA